MLENGSKPKTPKELNANKLSTTPKIKSSPLASPSLGKKFLATSLLVSEKSRKKDISKSFISMGAQNPLLKYALGSDQYNDINKEDGKAKAEGAGFKSALEKNKEKNQRKLEIAKLQELQFNFDYKAVRMPNKKAKISMKSRQKAEESKNSLSVITDDTPINNMICSPSGFLNGRTKVRKETCQICICGRMPIMDDSDCCPLCEK